LDDMKMNYGRDLAYERPSRCAWEEDG